MKKERLLELAAFGVTAELISEYSSKERSEERIETLWAEYYEINKMLLKGGEIK